jgi:hypothetical protein
MTAALTLVPFGTATLTMAEPLTLAGGPKGTRAVVDLVDGRFEGRLAGHLVGRAGADWVLVGTDGTACLDVRYTISTDDGALVYVECVGRLDLSPTAANAVSVLSATFETGDERYADLNKALVLIRAETDGTQLTYAMFRRHFLTRRPSAPRTSWSWAAASER